MSPIATNGHSDWLSGGVALVKSPTFAVILRGIRSVSSVT
jgi:hypothetical protein